MSDALDGLTVESLGGVGIKLTEESKEFLFNLINELIPADQYFQSFDPGYTYINGNVTKKAHITVCTSIKNADLKERFEKSNLEINQHSTKIKEIQINLGWQDLYYIIVAIPEMDKDILDFDQWIRTSNDVHSESYAFDPHISLCYIKNPGAFPEELFEKLKQELIGKSFDFDSIHFSLPEKKGDVDLIKF